MESSEMDASGNESSENEFSSSRREFAMRAEGNI